MVLTLELNELFVEPGFNSNFVSRYFPLSITLSVLLLLSSSSFSMLNGPSAQWLVYVCICAACMFRWIVVAFQRFSSEMQNSVECFVCF